MSWLRDRLEEVTAQLNFRDGGKTAATVRNSRPKQAPVPTNRDNQPGFQVTNNSLTRGLSRGFDTLNIADNGRSWNTRTPTYNSSVTSQLRDMFDSNTQRDFQRRNEQQIQQGQQPTNQSYREQQISLGNKRPYESLGAQLMGNSARFLNTAGAGISELTEAARGTNAILTDNDEALRASNERLRFMQQRMYQPDSGYLGAGTWFDSPEEQQTIGAAELTKRAGLNTLGTIAETAPFARVARPVKGVTNGAVQLFKGGKEITTGLVKTLNAAERGTSGIVPRIAMNAGMDTATGAGESAARQYAQTGKIDPKILAADTVASVGMGQLQVGASRITTKLAPNTKARLDAEATPENIKRAANPVVAQIDDQIATLEARRANATPREQVNIGKALDMLIEQRTRNLQGGFVRVPGKDANITPERSLNAIKDFDDVLRGNKQRAVIARISPELSARIKETTGIDVKPNAPTELSNKNAIHIEKGHGKLSKDVNPLDDQAIGVMPYVIENPDVIKKGKTVRGAPRIRMEKRIDQNRVAVVEVIKKGDSTEVVTYFNDSPSRRPDVANAPQDIRSKRNESTNLPNNIAENTLKVNRLPKLDQRGAIRVPGKDTPQGKTPNQLKATETRTNQGLSELSNIRKQYANDQEFFNKVILENVEAKGKIGDFARQIARRDATEGSIYNKNYLTEILDDELAPLNTKLDQAVNQTARRDDLAKAVRDLEKSTGQKGLWQKVSSEMRDMSEAEQIAYMSKAMTQARDSGVLAADFLNKQNGYTPKPRPQSTPVAQVGKTDPYIQEYADSLRQMDKSSKGGQMIPDGEGGYKRISENSPFYREYYKQNGKAPTKADYYEEALKQVQSGKADPAFMEYYNDMNTKRAGQTEAKVIDNKPPQKPSEAEWKSMLDQASQESKPTKNNLLKIRSEYNEQVASAVRAGDFETANKLRKEAREIGGQVKTITKENMPKNASAVVDEDFVVKTPMTLKDKQTKQTFVEATKEYLGQTASRKIDRDSKIVDLNTKFKLTDEEKLNAIISIDDSSVTPMNKKVAEYVDNYRRMTDEAYNDYTSNGVSMGFRHEYLPRIYKNPITGEAIDGNTYRLLQAGSSRQKGRSAELLNTDDLIYKDPTELLSSYYRSLDETVAGKQYLETLEKEGILTKSTDPVRGLRPIVAEGMQSSDGMFYYAQKDVANKLNELFGGKEATNLVETMLEKAAGVNSFVQSFVLSGGVPNTPINAFGIMQMTKEVMALHPIKGGKAFYAGMSKDFAKKVFTQKKDILKLMAENDVAPRVDIQQITKSGTQRISEAKGTSGKINQAWNEFTNDATFGRMMPALEVMHFENVYKSALKRHDSAKAASIAAESVKNFYGRTSTYKQAVRAKMTDDFTGAVFFAPRFRESMINFWGKNINSLNPKNLGKKEYRDNQKFLMAAGLAWGAMEALNMAMNDVWMHDNPDGKKDKLLVPADVTKKLGIDTEGKDIGIPYLSSIATVPRNAIAGGFNLATGRFSEAKKNADSFMSMPINTLGDIFTNEDYFGNPVIDDDATPAQKFTQAGAYIAKSNMQPWIREGLNLAGQNLPEDVKKSLGIKEKSRVETIANATESPFRFYDPKYYRYSDSWTPKGGKNEKFSISEQRSRAEVKKQIDSIPDTLKLSNKQKESYEAIRAVDFDDDGNLVTDNDPFYKAKRATALQDDAVFNAMKKRAELEYKLNGKPVDPLFNLSPSDRRVILWKQTLPAGTKDPSISQIYGQEWYQNFRADQDRYFIAKQAYNKKMGYESKPQKETNPYPEPSKELQAKLDVYYSLPKGTGQRSAMLKANPDILAHWDATEAWNNGERAKVGLGELPKDEPWSTGGGSGGGKRKKKDYNLDILGDSMKISKSLRELLKEATL